ncbi:hypothetical protein LOTGIDRAFT_156637 [Lottia gigantea]|uniref:F-box domain-containing protein n=1 Tax=Lottia gigantea TaxID=225164 RepID=V4BE53_LOTGI|nr:hypothetical protein LOTGIDRAFT_156637 [Lottia gigantea]ESP04032.1 hypothetical protein LOTGIDRAFT_156637 [Lottia gigantea]
METSINKLPSVVITQILAGLNWRDKLNVIKAITPWAVSLESSSSWPLLTLSFTDSKVIAREEEEEGLINNLYVCIEKYGKYMKQIVISYSREETTSLYLLLSTISRNCVKLISFHVYIKPKFFQIISLPILDKYIEIIKRTCIKDIKLRIIESAVISSDFNLFQEIAQNDLQNKVTSLKFSMSDFNPFVNEINIYNFSFLESFPNLEYLEIDQRHITTDLILNLVTKSLKELTLLQVEDNDNGVLNKFSDTIWKSLLKMAPCFHFNLSLYNVNISLDQLSPYMPLYKLTLDGATVPYITTTMLEDISRKYHKTLQAFCCNNSMYYEMVDSQFEVALLNLVKKCENLTKLVYDYPIHSSTVLLLAKCRKFKKLKILCCEVNYDCVEFLNNYPTQLLQWLNNCEYSYNVNSLEGSVSSLLNHKWHLVERNKY